MKEWIRKIPTPEYGHWGGAKNTCTNDDTKPPIDEMDRAFMRHDICLVNANLNSTRKSVCDKRLGEALRTIKGRDLKRPVYGRVYLFACRLIFRP